jgi:hypothetical protein
VPDAENAGIHNHPGTKHDSSLITYYPEVVISCIINGESLFVREFA